MECQDDRVSNMNLHVAHNSMYSTSKFIVLNNVYNLLQNTMYKTCIIVQRDIFFSFTIW
jgi:hypothetical protein